MSSYKKALKKAGLPGWMLTPGLTTKKSTSSKRTTIRDNWSGRSQNFRQNFYAEALEKSDYNVAKANQLMAGFRRAEGDPIMQSVAKSLGISNFNSVNDYLKLQSHLNAPRPAPKAPAPKAPAPKAPAPKPMAPQPLAIQQASPYQAQIDSIVKQISQQSQPASPPPPPEPPMPTVSGSTAVDANASGFTRAQSAAKKARLTSKGSSRLRINRTGQTSASSGLNIGV